MHATTTPDPFGGTAGSGHRPGRDAPSLEPVVDRRRTALRVRARRAEGAKAYTPGARE